MMVISDRNQCSLYACTKYYWTIFGVLSGFRVFVPGESPDARVRLPMPDICVSFLGACSVRNILCCSLLGRTDLEFIRPGNGRLIYAEWALAGETRGSGAGGLVRASLVPMGADICRIWCTSLMVHYFIYTGNLAQ